MDEVAAAVTLADRLGLVFEDPVSLRSTNNTVVWLRPSAVVAKVSHAEAGAARELAWARKLVDRGAPVVAPADVVGAEVHEVGGWFLTLWRHLPQDDVAPASAEAVAVALHTLHGALAPLAETTALPGCDAQLRDAIRVLEDPSYAPLLVGSDRALLHTTLHARLAVLQSVPGVAIHGSPHSMNVLVDDGRPVFVDLETVQRGPVEWDLAHLDPEVAAHYPAPLDHDVLVECRLAVSATTSTWCWDSLHRGADMRMHAEHHLAQVRHATRQTSHP